MIYHIIISPLSFFRYHTALSNTGSVALSTPYIDAFGAGVVITAAHTLYRGETNSQHSTNDQVIGVMGADFPPIILSKVSISYFVDRTSNK